MWKLIKNNLSAFMAFVSLILLGVIRILVKTKGNGEKFEEIKQKQAVLKRENKEIKDSIEVNKILKSKIEEDEHGKIKRARELLEEGEVSLDNFKESMKRIDEKKKLKDARIEKTKVEVSPNTIKDTLDSSIEDTI